MCILEHLYVYIYIYKRKKKLPSRFDVSGLRHVWNQHVTDSDLAYSCDRWRWQSVRNYWNGQECVGVLEKKKISAYVSPPWVSVANRNKWSLVRYIYYVRVYLHRQYKNSVLHNTRVCGVCATMVVKIKFRCLLLSESQNGWKKFILNHTCSTTPLS